MEETIEARVSPEEVWQMWERAHRLHGSEGVESGKKGKAQFRYQVRDVDKGRKFSMVWKTLFVRMIFTHEVLAIKYGSSISYKVEIKGLFAWPVRYFLGKKIQTNIRHVLKAMVSELETQRIK
ncbi:MAG: hypothetical protein ACD_17C00221G0005 [uncultured bacterium]|nr:MAG: hypothetical protein ACD_17C00221G0005 [uncultured bacterium]OGN69708.1 MAG: hypothetical protein A3F79_01345 [Chlamydiae bacterium RIFCSPLOWO2_12_FULL_45_20]